MKPIRILHLGDFYAMCEGYYLDALLQIPDFRAIDGVVLTGVATIPVPHIFSQAYSKLSDMLQRLQLPADRCIVTPGPKDLDCKSKNPFGLYSRYFYEPLKQTPYAPGVGNSTFWKGPNALQIVGMSSLTMLEPNNPYHIISGDDLSHHLEVASFVASLDGVSPVSFLAWYHPPLRHEAETMFWPALPYLNVSMLLHGHNDSLPLRHPGLGAPPRVANLIVQTNPKQIQIKRFRHYNHWHLSDTLSFRPRLRESTQK